MGAGLIATFHSKMLRRSGEDIAWAAVFDVDPERAARFAAASGATLARSEEEVLDSCDAVYVCTWTSVHARLVAAAAARGLAVFCEKPLAVDLATATAMAEVVSEAGVTNQVGLILRYSPAFCWLRQLIDDPASGRVMTVVYRDDQYIPVQGMYGSTWRGDTARAGAGTLLEHSIHDIDMLEYLAGTVLSVSARTAEFHGITGIEDAVAASMAFAGGGVGSLVSVWHDVLERPSLRRVEVFCERLWAALEGDWFGPVRWTRAGSAEQMLEGEALDDAVRAIDLAPPNADGAFIRAVRDGTPAHPSFATAVRAHAVVDALYRSAAAGGAPQSVPSPR
ncbi:MAG: hypothetical protein QOG64_1693 [Acidimicrobiaceae bacterium]|nr:hypothetical protein [Acidimicrobiaceae bacterium]